MKRKKLYRTKPELPRLLRMVRGAIGKEFVIKHYSYGAIQTKYPDMTRIIASAQQRKCRNKFQEAVAYAKAVIADPVRKAAWQKRLRRYNGVYNAAVKYYMLKDKHDKQNARLLTEKLIRQAFADGRMGGCADVRMCRCADGGCADVQMCRCADVRMCGCADVRMEDVRMEDVRMEDVRMGCRLLVPL